MDALAAAGLVVREVRVGAREGAATKIILARRSYATDRADLWQVLTNAERIPRWFLPVSGDLSVGGRYQFEGNAGGVVESCDAPESFAVTWEFGGNTSWLTIRLTEDGTAGGTTLELEHESVVPQELWDQYGPGALGLGWDGALYGLGLHIDSGGEPVDPSIGLVWPTSPEGVAFHRLAEERWAAAAIAAGDSPEAAQAAADRILAFYTVSPD